MKEHLAVAVDDEGGDVALPFLANPFADAPQTDDRFDDTEVRAGIRTGTAMTTAGWFAAVTYWNVPVYT